MRLRKVGEYYFVDNEITGARAMWLCIPSKFRIEGFERVRLPIGADGWQWDGNVETPTLKPSVHTFGHWHGWVRNGFLVEA